jgi:hypothetical protein
VDPRQRSPYSSSALPHLQVWSGAISMIFIQSLCLRHMEKVSLDI